MLRIKPFAAIRPQPNHAAQVASVPYDVVNADEARGLAHGQPHSFLHVIRSEIDLPPDTDAHDDAVYARAKQNLDGFIHDGILSRQPAEKPRIYLYRQVMNHRSQTGVVCCCHIDDYANDIIKKHEKTRKDKEDDRTRHVLELNAHAEPVFLAYRQQPEIDALVDGDNNGRPLYHFVARDGVTHTVWEVPDAAPYVAAFAKLPCAYIADGHHRSASAARAGMERRAANPKHTGEEEYNWFLAVLFPHNQLHIMPYNRVVKDLNGLSPDAFLKRLAEVATVTPTEQKQPTKRGSVCVYVDGRWHLLEFDRWHGSPSRETSRGSTSDPIGSLDVSLLQDRVLTPILGIGDVRTDPRIDFVGGVRGPEALMRRVAGGEVAAAFSMFPTSLEDLFAVSDAGAIMPPKSTWFEPKLRSGLLIHSLD